MPDQVHIGVAVDKDGFLAEPSDWTRELAERFASGVGVELTPAHWEVVVFIRDYYLSYRHLPNMRMFVKAVEKSLGPDKGNSRYLHQLFPGGPLKHSCLIAGLPKPKTCI